MIKKYTKREKHWLSRKPIKEEYFLEQEFNKEYSVLARILRRNKKIKISSRIDYIHMRERGYDVSKSIKKLPNETY